MINNPQNKAKFFAQYLDCCHVKITTRKNLVPKQIVCSTEQIQWIKDGYIQGYAMENAGIDGGSRKIQMTIESSHLLLTPLKHLAESDAIECMHIADMINSEKYGFITKESNPRKMIDAINEIKIWRLDVADFLRSRGYALPYLNLSVEQLVERGWVVLIK